jgi:hypothetical protein
MQFWREFDYTRALPATVALFEGFGLPAYSLFVRLKPRLLPNPGGSGKHPGISEKRDRVTPIEFDHVPCRVAIPARDDLFTPVLASKI